MGEAQQSSEAIFRTDLDVIIQLLRVFRDELPTHVATDTDEQHVRDYLTACWRDGSLVYYIQCEGLEPVGLALGVVFEDWTRPVRVCADLAFFLLPAYRGRLGLADRLYHQFELAAKRAGAAQMIMTNQHPDYEALADRFYRARGFDAVGRSYQKEL